MGGALKDCNKDDCNVYFNIHTNYSFAENPGFGLAQGQLVLKECPKSAVNATSCFGAKVTSKNTNRIEGLDNKLPVDAGKVTPLPGNIDVLIMYSGHDMDGLDQDDKNDQADSDGEDPDSIEPESSEPDSTDDSGGLTATATAAIYTTFFALIETLTLL